MSSNEIHKLNILLASSQDESALARKLTAAALSSYLGRPASAGELAGEVRTGDGKPAFPDFPGFHYNISHSGGLVVCGVSGQPLGIDIQKIPEDPGRALKIARHFFSREEQEALAALQNRTAALSDSPAEPSGKILNEYGETDGAPLCRLFTRFWTARESYIKLTGRGLAEPFKNFRPDLDNRTIITVHAARPVFLTECRAPDGFCMTVCSYFPIESVTITAQ